MAYANNHKIPNIMTLMPASSTTVATAIGITIIFIASTAFIPIAADRVNLARGKPTEQISTTWGGWPDYAVNGDKNPDFMASRCTHTMEEPLTWWLVDLLQEYIISAVEITTRYYHSGRLANFSVEVSTQHPSTLPGFPGSTSSPICMYSPTSIPSGKTFYYECQRPIIGRYLRVVKYREHNSALTMCEFEAYEPTAWSFRKADIQDGVPTILETFPPGSATILGCARSCVKHSGYRCTHIQFNHGNDTCRLLRQFQTSGTDKNPDWDLYTVTN